VANASLALAVVGLGGDELQGRLRERRADLLILNKIAKERAQEEAKEIVKWISSVGVSRRDSVLARVPGLAMHAPAFNAHPHTCFDVVLTWQYPIGKVVPRILGLAGNSACRPLFEALQADWEMKHVTTFHASCPALADGGKHKQSAAKPTCNDAGVCLCGEGGPRIWSLKKWLCKAMKSALSSVRAKKLLQDGDVVMNFVGTRLQGEEPEMSTSLFLHISWLFWKPFKPTSRLLAPPNEEADAQGMLRCVATHEYFNAFQLAKKMQDLGMHSWRLQTCFQLFNSQRPLVNLNPMIVRVRKMEEALPFETAWAAQQPRRGRGRMCRMGCDDDAGAEVPDAWGSAVEELGGGDSDEGGELDAPPGGVLADEGHDNIESDSASELEEESEMRDERLDSEGEEDDFGDDPDVEDYEPASVDEPGSDNEGLLGCIDREPEPRANNLVVGDGVGELDGRASTPRGSLDDVAAQAAHATVHPEWNPEQCPDDEPDVEHPLVEAPPPPLAVEVPHVAPRGVDRVPADVTIAIEGATLRFYAKKSMCVAQCTLHLECSRQRAMYESPLRTRGWQGRPIGYLVAWSKAGAAWASKAEHCSYRPSLEERAAARTEFKGVAGAAGLLMLERAKRAAEDSEPERFE